jgi:uncharacterized protein YdeI (YjbR/CyaY-like superfamily)
LTIHAAILPNKGLWYILLSKGVIKELNAREGEEVSVKLTEELSIYGMPEELEMCVFQEDGAMTFFDALTPGKQRSLIYIVSKIKNQDVRIRKSLVIAEHLVLGKGLLDYKKLNGMFEDENEQNLR